MRRKAGCRAAPGGAAGRHAGTRPRRHEGRGRDDVHRRRVRGQGVRQPYLPGRDVTAGHHRGDGRHHARRRIRRDLAGVVRGTRGGPGGQRSDAVSPGADHRLRIQCDQSLSRERGSGDGLPGDERPAGGAHLPTGRQPGARLRQLRHRVGHRRLRLLHHQGGPDRQHCAGRWRDGGSDGATKRRSDEDIVPRRHEGHEG